MRRPLRVVTLAGRSEKFLAAPLRVITGACAIYSPGHAGLSGEIRDACESEYATTIAQLKVVMAGLDPAIHVVATSAGDGGKRVDARVEPAHDDLQLVTITIQQPAFIPRTALPGHGDIRGNDTEVGKCPGM